MTAKLKTSKEKSKEPAKEVSKETRFQRQPVTPANIELTIVNTIEGFAELEDSWNQFDVDPMNGFDWNFAWWNGFSSVGRLHIVKFESAGSVIGIAPFYIDRWFGLERLRFIGSGKTCTEYVDVIGHCDHLESLDEALVSYLLNQQFSIVELECTNNNRLANRVSEGLAQQYRCDNRTVEPSWRLELPESWEAFVQSTRKSLRRKVRKAEKRIESGEVHFSSTARGASVEDSFIILRDLHQQRFHSKGKPGAFADRNFELFLKDALKRLREKQQAEIIVLYREDIAIGAQLWFDSKSGYQFYQSGYSTAHMKLEPGHIMFTAMAQKAIARGDTCFDFLRGDEPYKEFWGAAPVELRKHRLVSKKGLPSLVARGVEASRNIVSAVRTRRGS